MQNHPSDHHSHDPKLLVAMDFDAMPDAVSLAQRLNPAYCRLKVGKELFTSAGPQVVDAFHQLGFDVFLDLKFHDIPNTCSKAVKAAKAMGVWMVNVHASGGERMMMACRDVLEQSSGKNPLLIGVTVLTSMTPDDLKGTGIDKSPEEQVVYLANLAKQSGLDGVVCSAMEAPVLRSQLGNDFALVTPGIRLPTDAAHDQRRVVTPEQAIRDGSSYLVMGRSITQADDPIARCEQIHQSILATLAS